MRRWRAKLGDLKVVTRTYDFYSPLQSIDYSKARDVTLTPVRIRRARDAMRVGVALAPEDRKSTGLVLGASVGTNVSMAVLPRLARGPVRGSKCGTKPDSAFCITP
jgi:ABC-type sugar transport system ATPase subunit